MKPQSLRYIAALIFLTWSDRAWPADRLVIITPHLDAIRSEFGRGFAEWHFQKYGQRVEPDFRQVGGTSDALRFVQSEFDKKPAGIGLDCFWGVGQEPYLLLADKKLLVRYEPPSEILDPIPESINGVDVYDPNKTWYGAALSSFGILENLRVQKLVNLPLRSEERRVGKECRSLSVPDDSQ